MIIKIKIGNQNMETKSNLLNFSTGNHPQGHFIHRITAEFYFGGLFDVMQELKMLKNGGNFL